MDGYVRREREPLELLDDGPVRSGECSDVEVDEEELNSFLMGEVLAGTEPRHKRKLSFADKYIRKLMRRGKRGPKRGVPKVIATQRKKRKRRTAAHVSKLTPQLEKLMQEATTHYLCGSFDDAVRVLKEVVRRAPGLHDPFHMLGIIYQEEYGDPVTATGYYLLAAHLVQTDLELWRRIGEMSQEIGNIDQAIYCFKKCLKTEEGEPNEEANFALAMCHLQKNDHHNAIKRLHVLFEIHPDDALLLNELSKSLMVVGDRETLLSVLLTYHRQTGDLETAKHACQLQVALQQYAECIEFVSAVASAEKVELVALPIDMLVSYTIAALQVDANPQRELDAVWNAPDVTPQMIYAVAAALAPRCQETALRWFKRGYDEKDALAVEVMVAEQGVCMARCLVIVEKDYEAAARVLQGVLARDPGNSGVIITLADILEQAGKHSKADELLARLTSTDLDRLKMIQKCMVGCGDGVWRCMTWKMLLRPIDAEERKTELMELEETVPEMLRLCFMEARFRPQPCLLAQTKHDRDSPEFGEVAERTNAWINRFLRVVNDCELDTERTYQKLNNARVQKSHSEESVPAEYVESRRETGKHHSFLRTKKDLGLHSVEDIIGAGSSRAVVMARRVEQVRGAAGERLGAHGGRGESEGRRPPFGDDSEQQEKVQGECGRRRAQAALGDSGRAIVPTELLRRDLQTGARAREGRTCEKGKPPEIRRTAGDGRPREGGPRLALLLLREGHAPRKQVVANAAAAAEAAELRAADARGALLHNVGELALRHRGVQTGAHTAAGGPDRGAVPRDELLQLAEQQDGGGQQEGDAAGDGLFAVQPEPANEADGEPPLPGAFRRGVPVQHGQVGEIGWQSRRDQGHALFQPAASGGPAVRKVHRHDQGSGSGVRGDRQRRAAALPLHNMQHEPQERGSVPARGRRAGGGAVRVEARAQAHSAGGRVQPVPHIHREQQRRPGRSRGCTLPPVGVDTFSAMQLVTRSGALARTLWVIWGERCAQTFAAAGQGAPHSGPRRRGLGGPLRGRQPQSGRGVAAEARPRGPGDAGEVQEDHVRPQRPRDGADDEGAEVQCGSRSGMRDWGQMPSLNLGDLVEVKYELSRTQQTFATFQGGCGETPAKRSRLLRGDPAKRPELVLHAEKRLRRGRSHPNGPAVLPQAPERKGSVPAARRHPAVGDEERVQRRKVGEPGGANRKTNHQGLPIPVPPQRPAPVLEAERGAQAGYPQFRGPAEEQDRPAEGQLLPDEAGGGAAVIRLGRGVQPQHRAEVQTGSRGDEPAHSNLQHGRSGLRPRDECAGRAAEPEREAAQAPRKIAVGGLQAGCNPTNLDLLRLRRVAGREELVVAPEGVVARVGQAQQGVVPQRARLGVVVGRVDVEVDEVLGRVLADAQVARGGARAVVGGAEGGLALRKVARPGLAGRLRGAVGLRLQFGCQLLHLAAALLLLGCLVEFDQLLVGRGVKAGPPVPDGVVAHGVVLHDVLVGANVGVGELRALLARALHAAFGVVGDGSAVLARVLAILDCDAGGHAALAGAFQLRLALLMGALVLQACGGYGAGARHLPGVALRYQGAFAMKRGICGLTTPASPSAAPAFVPAPLGSASRRESQRG
ncbi:transcription factor [Babesia caballi]|uniref:Transcription factor n=1 Tax=Babesia caballi TaxID=5871 RepID=A0AAV4LY47_BABCB|nr:transcription factor [Babesia caballi]